MSNSDRETLAPLQPESPALPDERDRELLDYLIDRACKEMLRSLGSNPKNDNKS